jgi:hypothetical protein
LISRRSINAELARRLTGGQRQRRLSDSNTHTFDITSDQRLIDRIFRRSGFVVFHLVIKDTETIRLDRSGAVSEREWTDRGEAVDPKLDSPSLSRHRRFGPFPHGRIVVAGSARLGLATGFGPEVFKDLPDSERFYAGAIPRFAVRD